MTAKILQFPDSKKIKGYKIPLYTDEEIFLTAAAINIFCDSVVQKVNEKNITDYDPTLVINALVKAKESNLFSHNTKSIFKRILQSVEKIEIRV